MQGKLDAGAEVVLTQPPLIWGRAEQWMQEADVLRLADQGKVGGFLASLVLHCAALCHCCSVLLPVMGCRVGRVERNTEGEAGGPAALTCSPVSCPRPAALRRLW